jgi:hypothetical protein
MVSISKTPNDDDPIIPNEIISKNERKKERKKGCRPLLDSEN